ncbi:MAG TPA: hypothetical protein VFC67_20430 [Prolixibacteraceae bacterium]|nr:hypothetical protein [Prolixibacteraceae bacterium]
MKNNELQNTWKNIDAEINRKTTDELNQYLAAKCRKTMNKFLFLLSFDIVAAVGLIVFLIFTTINREGDLIYQANNLILGVITLSALIVSFLSLKKLQVNKYNLPLKEWLEQRIKLLSAWLLGKYSKLYIVLIPVLVAMIMLSIHVYYEYKPFLEVMKDRESIYGMVAGFTVGLFVSFYAVSKIRKYQLKNLEFLNDMYRQLCNIN